MSNKKCTTCRNRFNPEELDRLQEMVETKVEGIELTEVVHLCGCTNIDELAQPILAYIPSTESDDSRC